MIRFLCCTLLCLLSLLSMTKPEETNMNCPQHYSLTIPEAAIPNHRNRDKLIIAHRGASFHLPEHTIEAYQLALEMGADFVEPDLIATRDGHLISMHTADLNVTTNVQEVFADRQWFSPFVNRTGYWSFNFTLEEIKQLRVRQRLPRARSTRYDGMFQVPTLQEIQQLVNDWNERRVPQLLLHTDGNGGDTSSVLLPKFHYQQSAGVYAELKASLWFRDDANINLVDLFLQTLKENPNNVFDPILDCPPLFKFDEYKLPPLVVQSFEGYVLQELTEQWNATIGNSAPLPPRILLVSSEKCWEETVWIEIGGKWRNFVQGLGMDKVCFPSVGEDVEQGKAAKGRAEEFNLVIHPYTERPEQEFLMDGFQDGLEETQYLFCQAGAQGIFSESIHSALIAARVGCPQDGSEDGTGDNNSANTDNNDKEDHQTTQKLGMLCWENTTNANLYLGLASFIMGVLVTVIISTCVSRELSCTRRLQRQQQVPIDEPSHDEPPNDELL